MHGIYQYKPFSDAAFSQAFFYFLGDIDKGPARWDVEPEFFSVTFHDCHHIKPAGKAQERKLEMHS